jgi:hypothetical protein
MPILKHPSHPIQHRARRIIPEYTPLLRQIFRAFSILLMLFPVLFPLDFLRQTAADKKQKKIVNVVERLWMRVIVVRRHRLVLQCYPWAPKNRRTLRLSHPSRWLSGSQHKVHIFGGYIELTRNLLVSLLHSELSEIRNDILIVVSNTDRKGVRVNLLSIKS